MMWSCAALAAGWFFTSWAVRSADAAIPPYQLVGQFGVPAGTSAFDTMPDGRVLFLAGTRFLAADVRLGASPALIGTIPAGAVSSFGASFVSVSPDGATVAVGDNNFGPSASVGFVRIADLSSAGPVPVVSVAAPNQEACWSGSGTLLVAGFGNEAVVTRIDAVSHSARTVIRGIGDGSGGVAVRGGRVFAGLGYDASGGATTGQARAFDLAALETGGAPAAFGSGTLVARALSGGSLGFDSAGNLLVGGGDFFSGSGDFGAAAVIDGASVLGALGGGAIDPIASQLRLSPAGAGAFYSIRFNAATEELLVSDGATIFRYAVPTPGATGVLFLTTLLAGRRRRNG